MPAAARDRKQVGRLVRLRPPDRCQVLAFDAVTGAQLRASTQFDGPIFAEPIVVNGRLYAEAWDGELHAFDPS